MTMLHESQPCMNPNKGVQLDLDTNDSIAQPSTSKQLNGHQLQQHKSSAPITITTTSSAIYNNNNNNSNRDQEQQEQGQLYYNSRPVPIIALFLNNCKIDVNKDNLYQMIQQDQQIKQTKELSSPPSLTLKKPPPPPLALVLHHIDDNNNNNDDEDDAKHQQHLNERKTSNTSTTSSAYSDLSVNSSSLQTSSPLQSAPHTPQQQQKHCCKCNNKHFISNEQQTTTNNNNNNKYLKIPAHTPTTPSTPTLTATTNYYVKNWINTQNNTQASTRRQESPVEDTFSKSAPDFYLDDLKSGNKISNTARILCGSIETTKTKSNSSLQSESRLNTRHNCNSNSNSDSNMMNDQQNNNNNKQPSPHSHSTTPDKCSSFTLLVTSTNTSISCDLIENVNNQDSNAPKTSTTGTCENNTDNNCCSNQLSHCQSLSVASLPDAYTFNSNLTKTLSGCDLVQSYFTKALNTPSSSKQQYNQHFLTINSNKNPKTTTTTTTTRKIPKYTTKLTSRLSKLLNINSTGTRSTSGGSCSNDIETTIGCYDADDNHSHQHEYTTSVSVNDCYYSNYDGLRNNHNEPLSLTKAPTQHHQNNNCSSSSGKSLRLNIKKYRKSYKSTSELDNYDINKYNQTKANNIATTMPTTTSTATSTSHQHNIHLDDAYKNVKSRTTHIAKDLKSKASNLLKRRHTDTCVDKSILPTKEDTVKWQTSFEHLLRHKYGVTLFSEFLKTEFSVENIEFWLACEDYKNTEKEQKLASKARKILVDYVQIGAQKEVNLEIELRKQTEINIEQPTYDTFERAQKRIQALMEKDSYPRFLESDLYKDLCKVVNAANNVQTAV